MTAPSAENQVDGYGRKMNIHQKNQDRTENARIITEVRSYRVRLSGVKVLAACTASIGL